MSGFEVSGFEVSGFEGPVDGASLASTETAGFTATYQKSFQPTALSVA